MGLASTHDLWQQRPSHYLDSERIWLPKHTKNDSKSVLQTAVKKMNLILSWSTLGNWFTLCQPQQGQRSDSLIQEWFNNFLSDPWQTEYGDKHPSLVATSTFSHKTLCCFCFCNFLTNPTKYKSYFFKVVDVSVICTFIVQWLLLTSSSLR